ncbi:MULTISPECIES: ATP-binding protein [unclassified Streptomyces]|uniref:ATP-binding protein n=1 Tax=unclassified Streptomyces TaxID=2593676 RepID=UPI000DC79F1C|nr:MULTISPECIES: ATP-binding protein [unclassified Streptomyces]AWZ09965.1 ATP-binding protein [Streptomyces sp. ICC4]AWZ18181.1 ATP-binding protein [Streptomyces sp. ICC1]
MGSLVPLDECASLVSLPIVSALALDGCEPIAGARRSARDFMTAVQAVHGLPVSERAMSMVELVVSELVTNSYKYAPGPCLLELEVVNGAVEISVWDTGDRLPVASPADPGRVGQHGLEIAMAVCRSFEVRRESVGKRVKVAVALADDPGGNPAGRMS